MTAWSELPWVSTHPGGWDVVPLFGLADEVQAPNVGNREQDVLSLSYGQIIKRDIEKNLGLLPASFETYNVVEPGDVVMRLTDLQNDKRSLRTGLVEQRGIITAAYTTLRFGGKVDPRFGHYYLHALDVWKVFYGLGGGVRQSMKFADVRRLPVLLPPMEEQARIADFLERETARIDALVDKKRRLIDLLEEKRTATITQAVTKGLDPSVPMKDSGVRSLGDIPTHWDAGRLKNWWTVLDCKHRTSTYVDAGVPIVGTVQVKPGRLSLAGAKHTTYEEYLDLIEGGRRPHEGDIIYSRNASLGSAAYVEFSDRFCMGQDVCLIRSSDQSQLYLMYLLSSAGLFQQVDSLVVGATFKRINVDQIRNYRVPHPPRFEQDTIARFLDDRTDLLNTTMAKAEGQLGLLAEYRQALITAAVTGELDLSSFDGEERLEMVVS